MSYALLQVVEKVKEYSARTGCIAQSDIDRCPHFAGGVPYSDCPRIKQCISDHFAGGGLGAFIDSAGNVRRGPILITESPAKQLKTDSDWNNHRQNVKALSLHVESQSEISSQDADQAEKSARNVPKGASKGGRQKAANRAAKANTSAQKELIKFARDARGENPDLTAPELARLRVGAREALASKRLEVAAKSRWDDEVKANIKRLDRLVKKGMLMPFPKGMAGAPRKY